MRILVVSQYFWPENFRINDLVSELIGRGHEVTVLTGWPNYPDGHVFPEFWRYPGRFEAYGGAAVVRVPLLPRASGSIRLALNYLSFVITGALLGPWRLRGRNFDAIFVFEVSPITVALPALLLRHVKKAPLLLWVLDLWPDTLSAVGVVRSPHILKLVGRLVKFIYRRCDRILVQSRAFTSNIQKYGGDAANVRYFPGWAESIFRGGPDAVSPSPEVAQYAETFNVLFAGNIGESQDFPAVMDAAEALRDRNDVRWLILGDGRAADWVKAEINRRRLEDRVVMLGRFPIERMPSFFCAADVLLVSLKGDPIFSLTIPGKVQSYLGAGVPIVGMLDGEGARIIEEAGAGLVCPSGQGRMLAERVRQFLQMSPEERAAMGRRGREYCERHFDRAVLISSLERWMMELRRERAFQVN